MLSTRRPADRGGGRRVAGAVGGGDAQVVEAVRHRARAPVVRHRSPAAARRDLVVDARDARCVRARVGGRRGQRDRAAEVGARVAHRGGRSRVVDEPVRDGAARRLVAGRVGRDGPEVVAAVGERRRVERGGVRSRDGGADGRPGVGAGRGDLEAHLGHARAGAAGGIVGVGRRARQRDGLAQVLAGVVLRARRRRVVHAHVRGQRVDRLVAGVVKDDHAQLVDAVGDRNRVPARGRRRPARAAVGRVLVADARDAGGVRAARIVLRRGERNDAADVHSRVVHRGGRGVRSVSHVHVAWLVSVLPAGSIARTAKS